MRALSVLVLIALVSAAPAAAQEILRVVESTPAPSDSSVATETTVSFTFSHAVDTSARFGGEGPVAFYAMGGDSLRIDSTYFSADLTTLSFDVTHQDTTDFVWILTGARSEEGLELCSPYGLTYTTKDRWGSGVVEGFAGQVVSLKAGACRPYLAALLDARPDSSARLAAAANLNEQSYFAFEGVREGTYWPILLWDHDRDGLIRPDWERAGLVESNVGTYDPEFDGDADSIVVRESSEINVDILAMSPGSNEGYELPGTARLLQNYPNPFRDETTITFETERPLRVTLSVFDVLGRRAGTPASDLYAPGRHEVNWSPGTLPTGLYLLSLSADGFLLMRPMVRIGTRSD